MQPRPYQAECLSAIDAYLAANDGNPCVVIPTGGGKTPIMAWLIEKYLKLWPETRILVLAHVRELLEQGVAKMRAIWPAAPIGIYSAGLGAKDTAYPITYASIQSIHAKAAKFSPWDLIFVDEAHRIPLAGETTYRKFIAEAREWARLHKITHQRVIGFTATPFRLNGGPICGPDNILNEICYQANVADLIAQGYLCKLTSKAGKDVADVSGVKVAKGEFVTAELMAVAGTAELVKSAVAETLTRAAGRQSLIFFCINVEHAALVSAELASQGVTAPVIHAGTPPAERSATIDAFTAGRIRAVCNVNVLSEGFDAQRIDCVVLLRPTASPGLFYQQVGRGLRLHADKANCLVLDFAGNTERHGPIDALDIGDAKKAGKGDGEAPAKTCPECKEIVAAGVRSCPECGFEFPIAEAKHAAKPFNTPIISEPDIMTPTEVEVLRHEKAGRPPSLRVKYWDGVREVSEFVCFQHEGFAGHKARTWWRNRFGDPKPASADEALQDMHLAAAIKDVTESLTIKASGKYYEVQNATLKTKIARPV